MIGSIIGDVVGSFYEFYNIKTLGDSESAFQLANYMGNDEIIEKYHIYEKTAIHENHRDSIIKLAQMFEFGCDAFERHIVESIYWYRKPANLRTEIYAKCHLAEILRRKKMIIPKPKDY